VEDPFADVAELTGSVDLAGIDVVLAVGGGSVTAIAVAMSADVPLTALGVLERRRLEAIGAAVDAGVALHRPVADVHVDGIRRLITGPIEIRSPRPVDLRADGAKVRFATDATVRISAEMPMSGRLVVNADGHPSHRADRVGVTSSGGPAQLVASPRPQSFTELDIRLHARQLRELLLS
jgi:hypothetical protein